MADRINHETVMALFTDQVSVQKLIQDSTSFDDHGPRVNFRAFAHKAAHSALGIANKQFPLTLSSSVERLLLTLDVKPSSLAYLLGMAPEELYKFWQTANDAGRGTLEARRIMALFQSCCTRPHKRITKLQGMWDRRVGSDKMSFRTVLITADTGTISLQGFVSSLSFKLLDLFDRHPNLNQEA